MAKLEAEPDELCEQCKGTGIRTDAVGVKYGYPNKTITNLDNPRKGQRGWCNGCDGKGTRRPTSTYYPFSTDVVEEFTKFLNDCGGFKIL
jgi:hypothetical protein